MRVTVFAPGSVGNVGPGFDVLGLAIDGIGDRVTVEPAEADRVIVSGCDAGMIPSDPSKNVAAIAAHAMARGSFSIHVEKGLPCCAGLGGSASSSVAGALAAALACGLDPTPEAIMRAALEGEALVSGRHLDNIAPITLGGIVLARSIDPMDVVSVPAPEWRLALITPKVRIETKQARAILPEQWDRASWIRQMANTTALALAFATSDRALARRALEDLYAEPRRAPMIPHFYDVERGALDAGAFGCSISGSGPTIFALVDDAIGPACLDAMRRAMAGVPCEGRLAAIALRGAHRV